MKLTNHLFIALPFILSGCNSGSDDVSITNTYITPPQSPEEPKPVGAININTAFETDFLVVAKDIDSLEYLYSNSNEFYFDENGYLINKSGHPLLAYPVNFDGSSAAVSISVTEAVKIDYEEGNPKATDKVSISTNLPKSDNELLISNFDNQDPLSFNNSTSVTVFDSLGTSHTLTIYFIHTNLNNNTWDFRIALNGSPISDVSEQVIDFTSNGVLDINDSDLDGFITTNNGLIENQIIPLSNGAEDLNITLDFTSNMTSSDNNFEVTSLTQSGFYTDHLKELTIGSDGLITLSYIHQDKKLIGKIALSKFTSPASLQPMGNSLWAETENSGKAIYGEAEKANFNSITPLTYNF